MELVTDTCVLSSLHKGGVLREAFLLSGELIAPDVIELELEGPNSHVPDWQGLITLGLRVYELPGEHVAIVEGMAKRYAKPSRVDLFALVLAQQRSAILLTDDVDLRKAASKEGVRTQGTIWLLDQMIHQGVLDYPKAQMALRAMSEKGTQLSQQEIARFIQRWKDPKSKP